MRILVTGARGQLGRELVEHLASLPHHHVTGFDHAGLDVAKRDLAMAAVVEAGPEVIIHAAAWTDVDGCERDPDRAWLTNALGTRHVVEAARAVGARVVYVSTDYVFDGELGRPYTEWDTPNPLSTYGASKLGGERELRPEDTVVRTSWVCGRYGRNFVTAILTRARALSTDGAGGKLKVVDDQHGCLTVASDLAVGITSLALSRRPGVFHLTNQGPTSRFDLARSVVAGAGLDPTMVEPISTAQLDPAPPARRPASAVLDNAALRLGGMDLLDDAGPALARLMGHLGSP